MEAGLEISVTDAKAQLTDLVRRAERGDDVILTRHGQPTVRLVPIVAHQDKSARRRIMEAARRAGSAKAAQGEAAASSQDFLYDEAGLPR